MSGFHWMAPTAVEMKYHTIVPPHSAFKERNECHSIFLQLRMQCALTKMPIDIRTLFYFLGRLYDLCNYSLKPFFCKFGHQLAAPSSLMFSHFPGFIPAHYNFAALI